MNMRQLVEFTRNHNLSDRDTLANSALGLVCEAGEFGDIIKKVLYQGHTLDKTKAVKELGDVLWYVELACIALDVSRDEVEQVVYDKLLARYPNGFSTDSSTNRKEK